MTFSPTPGGPVSVMGLGASAPGKRPALTSVWLDAADGHVLDQGPLLGGVLGLAHDVHEEMLIPGVGRQVVGWLGVAMLIQSLTGLWLWWPRVGGVKMALSWKRSGFLTMRLHHLAGVLMMIPLAVLSVTGIWIAFPQIGQALSGPAPAAAAGLPRRERGPRFAPPIAMPHLTADQAVDAASAEGPDGARVLSIALPSQGASPGLDGADRRGWRGAARHSARLGRDRRGPAAAARAGRSPADLRAGAAGATRWRGPCVTFTRARAACGGS